MGQDRASRKAKDTVAGKAQRLALIDVPLEAGADDPGASCGAQALRMAGLASALKALGHAVFDKGSVTPAPLRPMPRFPGKMLRAREIAAWSEAVRRIGLTTLESGQIPLYLGGDHALSMGSIAATAAHCADAGYGLRLLWIDAHADFNSPLTSFSGNAHGMPLAWVCGEEGFPPMLPNITPPILPPGQVTIVGARSVDLPERTLLASRGVTVVDMRQIDEVGMARAFAPVIEEIRKNECALHVSFDVDALDPTLAPGVGTPVPGGLSLREAHLMMEMLFEAGCVLSVDLVELNLFRDERARSAFAMVDLVASLFGRTIRGVS